MVIETVLETYPIEDIKAIVLKDGQRIDTSAVKSVEVNNEMEALIVKIEDKSGVLEGLAEPKPDIVKIYSLDMIVALKA